MTRSDVLSAAPAKPSLSKSARRRRRRRQANQTETCEDPARPWWWMCAPHPHRDGTELKPTVDIDGSWAFPVVLPSGQSCFLLGAVGNHHSASTYLPSAAYHCAYDGEEDLIVPASVKAANGDEHGAVAHCAPTEAAVTSADQDFSDTASNCSSLTGISIADGLSAPSIADTWGSLSTGSQSTLSSTWSSASSSACSSEATLFDGLLSTASPPLSDLPTPSTALAAEPHASEARVWDAAVFCSSFLADEPTASFFEFDPFPEELVSEVTADKDFLESEHNHRLVALLSGDDDTDLPETKLSKHQRRRIRGERRREAAEEAENEKRAVRENQRNKREQKRLRKKVAKQQSRVEGDVEECDAFDEVDQALLDLGLALPVVQ